MRLCKRSCLKRRVDGGGGNLQSGVDPFVLADQGQGIPASKKSDKIIAGVD